jgi:FkbM family methyltransferase
MYPNLSKKISKLPLLRRFGRLALRTLGISSLSRDKKRRLKLAKSTLPEKIPLDASFRSGFLVFHDPNNPLIARGEIFESDVRSAIYTLFFLDRQRGNTPRFADIGANIGLHSLAVKEKFPETEVVAFDPSPFSWKYLKLTLEHNNIEGIKLMPIALGNSEGTADFYAWGKSSSGDSLRNTGRQPNTPFSVIKVPIRKFDDLPENEGVTVIKMDCEGAEVSIIQGMSASIARNRPLIVTEFYAENQSAFGITGSDVYKLVSDLSYSVYTLWFELLDEHKFLTLHQNGEENFILLPSEIVHRQEK